MSGIRRADPAARRWLAWAIVVGTGAGVALLVAFERYRAPLSDWLLADAVSARHLRLVFLVLAALLLVPLFAFATFAWSLGGRIVRAREFPPPGSRLIRDTVVLTGDRSISRGRWLKLLALACVVAAAVLRLLLWRLEALLRNHVTGSDLEVRTLSDTFWPAYIDAQIDIRDREQCTQDCATSCHRPAGRGRT